MSDPMYCTVEDVKKATDVKATAYADPEILRAIDSASRSVEDLTGGRFFYPTVATRYYRWPSRSQHRASWMLQLYADLLSLTSMTAGDTTIQTTDVFLEPSRTGPPYTRIEIDLSSTAVIQSGDTAQRAVAVTGAWGYCNTSEVATALGEDLTAAETGVDVDAGHLLGTGSTILIGSEYMHVTGRSMLDTGVDIDTGGDLTASRSDQTLACDTSTGIPQVGETILIGSERMLVLDAAGTDLTVQRAYDGSTLATHAAAASIYALRTLTVERGVLGTTAATHSTDDVVYRHVVPPLVRELAIAEVIIRRGGESSGYASTAGDRETSRSISMGEINDLRMRVETAHGIRRWVSAI